MPISPLAGKPAPKELLIDPSRLEREYYEQRPNLRNRNQLASFGTSGHRGSPLNGSFTEATFWPLLRLFVITGVAGATMALFTWARTRTRCPRRLSVPL
jgi:hypothetical protein